MLAGLHDILVITTPQDRPLLERFLKDGRQWGISIRYAIQTSPEGIAQAFLIGADFIGDDPCALILGNNFFYGHGLPPILQRIAQQTAGATILTYRVSDPERYGVVETDGEGRLIGIEERPARPKSNDVVTGLYFYDNRVVEFARAIQPSDRGELEITDVNMRYLEAGALRAEPLGRGVAWLDTGTNDDLARATEYVKVVEVRQGLKIACPEEIAWRMGLIDDAQLIVLARPIGNAEYGRYLMRLVGETQA